MEQVQETYTSIAIELIKAEENIRHKHNDKSIKEMAASLKTKGQLHPIRVYKKDDDKYIIITGHRRYKAAQEAKISHMTCIVCDKPKTDIDRLYTQAIENEQREDISPADRETYISALINAGQTQSQICENMGKSAAWISQTIKAKAARDAFGKKFADAELSNELDTYSAYQMAGATEAAVDKAIQALKENPKNKKAIFKDLERSKERTNKKGRPRKDTTYNFGYTLTINEAEKSVTIGADQHPHELIQELYKQYGKDFTALIHTYFEEKKYTITQYEQDKGILVD